MARKKSRFLQTPIEPFTVEPGLTADQLLLRMERISFQGRMLATAHRVWHKMLEDDVTIFLGMAGALSAGGLRMIVAYLIANRYVDCLVSTGANLYHDLHETRGQHHYIGSPHPDDSALAEDRIDRVYDTYASEEEFISNDSWIADFAATLEPRPYTSREFLHQLGGHLWKVTGRDGILTAAYRANVPIFCPAIADSSIGMGLSQAHAERGVGDRGAEDRHVRAIGRREDAVAAGDLPQVAAELVEEFARRIRTGFEGCREISDPAVVRDELLLAGIRVVDAIDPILGQCRIVRVRRSDVVMLPPCLVEIVVQVGARRHEAVDVPVGDKVRDDHPQAAGAQRARHTEEDRHVVFEHLVPHAMSGGEHPPLKRDALHPEQQLIGGETRFDGEWLDRRLEEPRFLPRHAPTL